MFRNGDKVTIRDSGRDLPMYVQQQATVKRLDSSGDVTEVVHELIVLLSRKPDGRGYTRWVRSQDVLINYGQPIDYCTPDNCDCWVDIPKAEASGFMDSEKSATFMAQKLLSAEAFGDWQILRIKGEYEAAEALIVAELNATEVTS